MVAHARRTARGTARPPWLKSTPSFLNAPIKSRILIQIKSKKFRPVKDKPVIQSTCCLNQKQCGKKIYFFSNRIA